MDMMDDQVNICACSLNDNDYVDITTDFIKATEGMAIGELVNDTFFGLAEAMTAIEMMDPKMDSGVLQPDGKRRIINFEQAVDVGFIKLNGLSYSEQLAIMDITFSCLVAWLDGHNLAQTVFTNVYFHKPHVIECRPLKAFCITLYKIIEIVRDFCHRAAVFEEEDFYISMYGYKLEPDVPEHKVISLLREVEGELNEIIYSSSNHKQKGEDVVALNARIRFVRLLYQTLLSLSKLNWKQASEMGESFNLLTTCLETFQTLVKTAEQNKFTYDDVCENFGFQPVINHRKLPATFPRSTMIKSNVEAFRFLEVFLVTMKQMCRIVNLTSFLEAFNYFVEMSSGKPCILSRSIMQVLYFSKIPAHVEKGANTSLSGLAEVLKESARSFISLPSMTAHYVMLSNNAKTKDSIDNFFMRCVRPFTLLIQVSGHNRARQRDRLVNVLEEFSLLQEQAENLDTFLNTIIMENGGGRAHIACYGTWVLYYTLRIMVMYLMSGFELELYSPHEYSFIYWYLHEFLFGWLVSCLNRAGNVLRSSDLNALDAKKQNRKSKKKKSAAIQEEGAYYHALQNICGAYHKATIALKMDGKIEKPCSQYDNERIRYDHRMGPLSVLTTPPFVCYSEYRDLTNSIALSGLDAIYSAVSRNFGQAINLLENLPNPTLEVADLIEVAKKNFIVFKVLAGGFKRGPEHKIEFDFSKNSYFPQIKLN